MRNGLVIFVIGFLLGSTLGIGGIWTQVVKPAKEQIEELEREHGILNDAVDAAAKVLREAVAELRSGPAPDPVETQEAFAPAEPRQSSSARALRIADELESKASLLEESRRARSR